MKTLTFKYTKKDGSVSSRTLLAMVTPSDKYAGTDLSDLDPVMAAQFAATADQLQKEYLQKLVELQNAFDLKHSYRQFLASGVSDINEI